MNIICDDETFAAARVEISDGGLATIIERIVHEAKASDLWDLTCILVVDPADDGSELQHILGFDFSDGPLADASAEFMPWWQWLVRHGEWYELLHTAGDTGYATFILVPVGSPLAPPLHRFVQDQT